MRRLSDQLIRFLPQQYRHGSLIMGRRASGSIPRVTVHRGSGRARIRFGNRTFWLGAAGSKEADANYKRILAAWGENGGSLPDDFTLQPDQPLTVPAVKMPSRSPGAATVADLLATTLAEVGGGRSIKELRKVSRWWRLKAAAYALEPYARTPALEFGPRILGDIARQLASGPMHTKHRHRPTATWAREVLGEIRRIFREAVAREELPPERLVALNSLTRLPVQAARPAGHRQPVPDADIEATCAHLPAVVADAVRFIRLTGCRPSEALNACRAELTTTGTTWAWQLREHKTKHHGRTRTIAVGPRARAILQRWWQGKADGDIIFSRGDLRRATAGPVKMRRLRTDGNAFDQADLRQRVKRAASQAGVPHWTPYQLRHSGLTAIRSTGGVDAAQAQADHADTRTLQRYAGPDISRQAAAVEAVG